MTIKSSQLRIPGKNPVRVATESNITLSGGAPNSVGGVSLALLDRILVWQQTDASQNGIYKVATLGTGSNGTWVRTKDADMAEEDQFFAGVNMYVQEGSYARSIFYLVTTGTITIGTDDLDFVDGGPVLRSDASGQAMTGVGTSGSPATYGISYTTQTDSTDLRDYGDATWYVYITNKSTATKITVKVDFSEDDSNFGQQHSEVIAAGAATESPYEAEFDISALSATLVLPLSLRVMGPKSRVSVKADQGTPQGYVTVWRQV